MTVVATLFDGEHANEALCCLDSAKANGGYPIAVCLDDSADSFIGSAYEKISLSDIEKEFPELLAVRSSRQWRDYVLTIRPFALNYALMKFNAQTVMVDSDVVFYSDVLELAMMLGDASFMVSHTGLESLPFSDGFLMARNDARARVFLRWWQQRCVEWCEWRDVSRTEYGASGYLSIFVDEPDRFSGIRKTDHPGIHASHWNMNKHVFGKNNKNVITVDDFPLVCFHHRRGTTFTLGD